MPRRLRILLAGGGIVVLPILDAVLFDVASPAARTGRLGDTAPAGLAGLAREGDRPAPVRLAPHVIRAARRAVQSVHVRSPRRVGCSSPQRPGCSYGTGPHAPTGRSGQHHRSNEDGQAPQVTPWMEVIGLALRNTWPVPPMSATSLDQL